MKKIINGFYLGLGIGSGVIISTALLQWGETLTLFIIHVIKTAP